MSMTVFDSSGGRFLRALSAAFLYVSMLVLIITALLKLISIAGHASVLEQPDPLLPFLSNRQLLAIVAIMEIGVASFLAFSRSDSWRKTLAVAWLMTLFLVYRTGHWVLGVPGSCSCLGNAADWLGVPARTLDRITAGVLVLLLAGSYSLIAHRLSTSGLRSALADGSARAHND
jgi:hypothetical protein